jgi:hypothetical protein
MPTDLIPFPISLIFIVIFGIVVEVALWKLRKNGLTYRWLSNLAIVVGAIVMALVLLLFVQPLL